MAGGRPTKYQKTFCEALVKHMAGGNSFESFGAIIHVARSTLFEWDITHAEFSDARKRGLDANLLFWENLAKTGAAGQLRRVASEVIKDNQVVSRTYAPAVFNATAWVFTMKNMHKWRDRIDVRSGDLPPDDLEEMSLPELEAEVAKLLIDIKKAKADGAPRKRR